MRKALAIKASGSAKNWKQFVKQQLAKGSPVLHKWSNRMNAVPSVSFFSGANGAEDAPTALRKKDKHWLSFWGGDKEVAADASLGLR